MTQEIPPPKKKYSFLFFILKPVYHLLYHSFAWTYDWAAALVSLGKWNEWIQTVISQVKGPRILELGYGPGHLQEYLLNQGEKPIGVDESRQMARIAQRRVNRWYTRQPVDKSGYAKCSGIIRGVAQFLPFPENFFSSVVSTFPAPFIFHPQTLLEAHRVLAPGGRLIILFTAWFSQDVWYGKWIVRVFPFARIRPEYYSHLSAFFSHTPFDVQIKEIPYKSSIALLIFATKNAGKDVQEEVNGNYHRFPE